MTTTATKVFRILGTTDDVTACELCGRSDLKATVALQPLDPDGGDDGEPVYYGSDCAARAQGWTQRDVVRAAKSADAAKRAAEQAAREAAARAESEAFGRYCAARHGVKSPTDLFDLGLVPLHVRREWIAAGRP